MAAKKKPNVIILHTDQQRYDSLGCTGNPYAITPNLDRLGSEGTVFHRHITANPVCMPSRGSLLSGRYPNAHGVWYNGVALQRPCYHKYNDTEKFQNWFNSDKIDIVNEVPTLADILAQEGYQTSAFGKLHLSPYRAPACYGFEESYAVWEQNPDMMDWYGPYYGFQHVELAIGHGEGVKGHYYHWLKSNYPEVVKKVESGEHHKEIEFPDIGDLYPSVIPEEAHHSKWISERVCDYLEKMQNSDEAFFVFAGFPDPHNPVTPPVDLAHKFETSKTQQPYFREGGLNYKPEAMAKIAESGHHFAGELTEESIRRIRQYTNAMVHLIDKSVGEICDNLKKMGLWENTIIIFTSDHGDFLGDYGFRFKSYICSNPITHIPYIMKAPGSDNFPSEINIPMSNADVVPTICDLLHIDLPGGVQGQSIIAALEGKKSKKHYAPVFCYLYNSRYNNFSLYDKRYRFTWYPGTDEYELYDHKEDPRELYNIADESSARNRREHLYQELLKLYVKTDNHISGRKSLW